ncbi:MAG: uL15 family ribosomal protein, partial [bacterium]
MGRGGKRGTYSGRGEKGQRKRAGHRIRPAARDIILKFPKLRGIKHKSRRPHTVVINVGDLEGLVKHAGATEVSRDLLVARRIMKKVTDLDMQLMIRKNL